jgi:hypothetical protein
MKQLFTILFFFSTFALAQMPGEALVYVNNNSLAFYNFDTHTDYQDLYTLVPLANQVYHYNNRTFIVSSGNYNTGITAVQVFPDILFSEYVANPDTMIFKNGVIVIELESFGNAFTVVGLTDSTALVTLPGTGHVQEINYITGSSFIPVADGIVGNPQGSCEFNSDYVALAMADWYAGVGNSVKLFNRNTGSIDVTIPTRLNTVDVKQLSDGDLVSSSWGSWSGAENYGTVDFIDGNNLTLTHSIMFPDSSKPNTMIQISDTLLYVEGYTPSFSMSRYLINLYDYSVSMQTSGFFSKSIKIKLLDGSYVVTGLSGTEIYSTQQALIDSIPSAYPFALASMIMPPINGVDENSEIAERFYLAQNYPNPFNPTTTISYSIPNSAVIATNNVANVNMIVYDALGRKVETLVNKQQATGNYSVKFNASNLPSGIYFYRLTVNNLTVTKKMMLLK